MSVHRTQGRGPNGVASIRGNGGSMEAPLGSQSTRVRRHISDRQVDPREGLKTMTSWGRGVFGASGTLADDITPAAQVFARHT